MIYSLLKGLRMLSPLLFSKERIRLKTKERIMPFTDQESET